MVESHVVVTTFTVISITYKEIAVSYRLKNNSDGIYIYVQN